MRGLGGSGETKRDTMLYPPTISYFPHNSAQAYHHSPSYASKPQPSQKQATPEHIYSLYAWSQNYPTEPSTFSTFYPSYSWANESASTSYFSPSLSERLTIESNTSDTTSTTQSTTSSESSDDGYYSNTSWPGQNSSYPLTASGKARLHARYLDLSSIPFDTECEACFCPSIICEDHQLDSIYAEIKGSAWKDQSSLPVFNPSDAVRGIPSDTLQVTSLITAVARAKTVGSVQDIDAAVLDLVMWKDDTRSRRQHIVQFRTQALALFRAIWSPVSKFKISERVNGLLTMAHRIALFFPFMITRQ